MNCWSLHLCSTHHCTALVRDRFLWVHIRGVEEGDTVLTPQSACKDCLGLTVTPRGRALGAIRVRGARRRPLGGRAAGGARLCPRQAPGTSPRRRDPPRYPCPRPEHVPLLQRGLFNCSQ
ncbi:unnamed protein product [Rangifer tarandus platyrhynchus]|uniref:Uncharacterized protein n=1 Tax=Rangifer tarandus platyrhynchus TaxID=3082113 RepID=A0AC60A296_RANTA